jgi:predicted nucleic acid-binding Zn ribbon protein
MSGGWTGSVARHHSEQFPHEADVDGSAVPAVPIGSAVNRLLRERGMEDALVLGRVTSCWEDVVGQDVARQVRPQVVRAGELVLSADHPAWATEMELAGSAVLGRLAEHLGDAAPKRLSVRVRPASRR